jgi:hypothetical protein
MAPLIVSALVGFGVKIATDLVMGGAKQIFKSKGAPTSFAEAFDKARGSAAAATPDTSAPKAFSLDPAGSRLMKAEASGSLPSASRAQAVATYQRLDDIPPQAV